MIDAVSAPLEVLLAPGRRLLDDLSEPGEIHAGPSTRAYVAALLAENGAPLLVVVPTDANELIPAGLLRRADAHHQTVHVDRTKREIRKAPRPYLRTHPDRADLEAVRRYYGE